MTIRNTALTLFLLDTLAACSMLSTSATGPAKMSDGVLTGMNGMTLYTFDRDVPGSSKSVCNAQCATNWPPLMASDGEKPIGDYSIITRDDGKKQWALNGKPLYFWSRDTRAGDRTGDGFNNVWHVVR